MSIVVEMTTTEPIQSKSVNFYTSFDCGEFFKHPV